MCNKRINHTLIPLMISLSLLLTPVIIEGQSLVPAKMVFYQPPLKVPSQYPTIQSAINAANSGQTVLVAPGTYSENIDFKGKKITVRSTNGAGVTTINGQWNGSVVTFSGGENSNSILKGFTITDGYNANGGGINCASQTSPIIRNCVITGNYAKNNGGGVYCGQNSSPTITDCLIEWNTAGDGELETKGRGGGIYCDIGCSALITNDTISYNHVDDWQHQYNDNDGGGGIYCKSSNPTITKCAIIENTTYIANAAGIYCESSSPIIDSCVINNNEANQSRGGAFCCKANSNPVITNCEINNNMVWSLQGIKGEIGGGFYCEWSSPTIRNCEIIGNKTYLDNQGAGGAYGSYHSATLFENCTIQYNEGEWGGGIFNEYGGLTIKNCEITNNKATVQGGGVYCHEDTTKLIDCLVRYNYDYYTWPNKGGGVYFEYGEANQQIINCEITCNKADSGGGVYCGIKSEVLIVKTSIEWNEATSMGAGVFIEGSDTQFSQTLLINCTLMYNWAYDNYDTTYGGAACIYKAGNTNPNAKWTWLINCLVAKNQADYCGGIFVSGKGQDWINGSVARIVNSTISDNTSNLVATNNAGAIWCGHHRSKTMVFNSILWNDTQPEIWQNVNQQNVQVSFSDVQGGWTGSSNINLNPQFINPVNDDYHLQHLPPGASPCIDAGDTNALPLDVVDLDGDGNTTEKTPIDLDGGPRVIIPNGLVDMGAYEAPLPEPDTIIPCGPCANDELSNPLFCLSQNTPNPCNRNKGTTISYSIPHASHVTLSIYNSLGQCVRILVNNSQESGIYSTVWKGEDDFGKQVPSGLYFYKIQAGEFSDIKKLTLLR